MGKINSFLKTLQRPLILISVLFSLFTVGMMIHYQFKKTNLVTHYQRVIETKSNEYLTKIQNKFETLEKKTLELTLTPIFSELLANNSPTTKETGPLGKTIRKTVGALISEKSDSQPFKDLLLVTPTGEVVYTLNNTDYAGKNLSSTPLSDSGIGLSFMRSFMGLSPDISAFYFDTVIQQPALYVSSPIFQGNIIIGVLILQIDQDFIYQAIEDYLGLEKTGEWVLANRSGSDTQIIAPTRSNPDIAFKKVIPYNPLVTPPLQSAVNARSGAGLINDYRGTYVIAAWDYIPMADWGIVTKIDYQEVMKFNEGLKKQVSLFIIITLALLTLALISVSAVRGFLVNLIKRARGHTARRIMYANIALVLCALFSMLGIYLYLKKNNSQAQALIHAQEKAQASSTESITQIESALKKISLLAQGVADSLELGSLTQPNIQMNIERKLKEEPTLFAFCVVYNKSNDLEPQFSAYGVRDKNSIKTTNLAALLKEKDSTSNTTSLPWYKSAFEQKNAAWIQPARELMSDELVITYATPFFEAQDTERKNPLGVVAAMYLVSNIKPMLRNLTIGETGYSFIVNKEGKFIYHPREKYLSKNTIYTAARQDGNVKLASINEEITSGKQGMNFYKDIKTNEIMWIVFKPFTSIPWSLGVQFAQEEITLPIGQVHRQAVWLVISFIAALLLLAIGFSLLFARHPLSSASTAATIIFMCGILAIWNLIQPEVKISDGIVINNDIGLEAYIDELTQKARQKHESLPVTLPTGIFLETWNISGSSKVDFTGTIWQAYSKKHQNIARELNFPEATNVRLSNQYKNKNNGVETIGSTINATIAQQFNFSKFPLDSQLIKIIIDHKDIGKNIILTPDLASYNSIRPTDLPGIDPKFKYYGFNIERSFFSLEKIKQTNNFGVEGYQNISEHLQLAFNILITRDIQNALIVYFIPLLVILISLFSIFAITGRTGKEGNKKTFVSIASYTGLLFALVALNVALRNQYPSGSILYMEYFFFYTYLTILILIVHGAIVQMEAYENIIDETITPIMKTIFWPTLLGIWFLTTVIVFYN